MTIHERMVARSEREKDLLKYGRSQERERIIKELASNQHIWRERVVYDGLIALIKGLEKKNEELLANPYYPSPHFTVIDEFDSDVFKLTAIEWEKLNSELDKD